MIIAHFFLRKVKGSNYLFVETTSSQGLEQPSPAAQALVELKGDEKRTEWIRKAYYEFSRRFPNLVLLDAMENSLRLESDHPSFDLVFRPINIGESKTEKLVNGRNPIKSVFSKLLKGKDYV